MTKVDVAMCVYGKPYNAAVTLGSLVEHSGQHIGRVFIQEDKVQPHNETVDYLYRCFPNLAITQHVPEVAIGNAFPDWPRLANDDSYRRSVRYQYAWETTERTHLFITHNDCLYSEDIIGNMMEAMGDTFVGVGMIGQCWNCPAAYAKVCSGPTHESYQPTYEEAVEVVKAHPGPRTHVESLNRDAPMPFPECRLNEFACLVNVAATRQHIHPLGPTIPFGCMTLDIGTDFFHALRRLGYRFKDYRTGFKHAPFSRTGGVIRRTTSARPMTTRRHRHAPTCVSTTLRPAIAWTSYGLPRGS